jgi:hypothetical protein
MRLEARGATVAGQHPCAKEDRMATAQQERFNLDVAGETWTDWESAVYMDPHRLRTDLLELGLPMQDVEQEVSGYESYQQELAAIPVLRPGVAYHAGSDPEEYEEMLSERALDHRSRLIDRIRQILGLREIRVANETKTLVEIPLFLLECPDVTDSAVEYGVAHSTSAKGGWSLKVFGNGAGGDGSVTVSDSGSFTSDNGERQLVFVPIMIVVQEVDVLKQGRSVGRGTRSWASFSEGSAKYNDAVRALTGDTEPQGPLMVTPAERFPLANAAPGTSEYQRTLNRGGGGSLELGVKAANTEVGVKASVDRETEYSLKLTLPAGHEYELLRVHGPQLPDGIRWSVS